MDSVKSANKNITFRKLLETIYDVHIDEYSQLAENDKVSRIYFPIDFDAIAKALKSSVGILHQILYYYDDIYTKDKKHFFTYIQDPQNAWCINFPLLCILLSEAREKDQHERSLLASTRTAAFAAWGAVIVALLTLIVQFVEHKP